MNILEHDTEGKFYHEYNNSNTTSSIVSSSSSSASSGGSRSTQDDDKLHSEIKQENLPTPLSSPRMESGAGGGDPVKEEPTQDNDSSAIFTCENCGKAAYNDGQFETIKLGDIFNHMQELHSPDGTGNRPQDDEGPPHRLCAQCLDSHNTSHFGGTNGSTAQQNNGSDCSNKVSTNSNSSPPTVLVTSCLPNHNADDKGLLMTGHAEEGQLLQGVPGGIIMQNSTHHHHEPEMHHDLQPQTFYHQGQHTILQQVKLETEPDAAMGHPQPHNLDNFMLIHDGAGGAIYPDNNQIISFQQSEEPDNQFQQQQQRQQVICDNQSAIQHVAVVTPGSDIKYTIPTSTIMQLQAKDQSQSSDHLIQFPSGQNHLISLGDGSVVSGDIVNSVPTTTGTFQFLDLSALHKGSTLQTTSGPTVVTHTAASTISSTLMTIPIPPPVSTITPTSSSKKKSSNKSAKKEKSAASGSGAKANKSSNNNNNNTPTDKKNAQKGPGSVKVESEKIPCDLCKKKFKNPKMAMNHYRRVHQKEARFVCEICGAVFSYRGSLDSHLVIHKQPPEKSHECGKCQMQFSVKANLRQHMRIHSDNPKKFPCDFCPSGFSKRVNLRYHIKRKHPEEAEKMSNNNNSNKDSPTTGGSGGLLGSNLLQAGLAGPITPMNPTTNPPGAGGSVGDDKDSKNQGSFKCEHCDRAFLFKNNLKAHLRTHTRDKKYTCELCTKSFIYKESLKNHMLLHSNELPYLCEVCGKKFRDRSNRRKHVKNVHKYLFVNGDINNPVKPGATPATPGSSQGGPSAAQPGEPPTKKRKSTKKAAQQLETIDETGQEGTSKTPRTIIKSPAAPRGKKAKAAAAAAAAIASAAAGSAEPIQNKAANTKSVIVSASTTASATVVGIDRKIIMSPSPKTQKSHEYVHSHPSLPVTVHVPLGSQGQFSQGRNIIVKASSTATSAVPPNHHQSPPALSPEMYHHSHSQQQQQQHGHGRGPASMQQNVIVYPKSKIPDHSQYPSSASSVISQTMQQAQYYVNPPPDQEHLHHHHHPGYSYLQLTSQQPSPSSILPHSIPSPNPTGFEYVIGSTNHLSSQPPDQRGNDPYGSSGGPGSSSQPMEIQVVNPEYSHHLYSSPPEPLAYDQPPQHYHWAPSAGHSGLNGSGGHPPNSSSPYQQLVVAPPVGSNGSSSGGIVNEGPPGSHQQHPQSLSLAQSYHHESAANLNPNQNPQAVYATTGAVQGHEVLDPSGNGGNFFYKDFDFSYL